MEQLKPFIEGLKANKFWIFCGVTLLGCIAVYYMVSSSLSKEEAAAAGKINSTVSTANGLQSAGVPVDPEKDDSQKAHPNNDTLSEMEKVVKAAAAATQDAWKKKHELQAKFQRFDKETIRETNFNFQKFLPAETVAFSDVEDEKMLPETVRTNYRDRIRDELPKLADLVGSYWKPNFAQNDPKPREVIKWNEDNQEYWHDRFTNFVSEWNDASESNLPRTLQVLYSTEDLWLLRSILDDVIGKTVFDKGDVYANDLSVIKKIDHILLGKNAEPAQAGLPGATGGAARSSSGMMNSAKMGQGGGNSGGRKKKADSSLDPANGRYVDNEGKDIPAKDYRAIYQSKGSTDKKKTHWKIAKRVKVRIGLQMDTREIQNLLANCANANFPIEVRSLRVNKHKPSKLKKYGSGTQITRGSSNQSMGGDAEDRAAGLAGAGGSGASVPGSGAGGMGGGGKGKDDVADDQGYTKPVEIYGYIYIYNKVDKSMFKILDEKQSNP